MRDLNGQQLGKYVLDHPIGRGGMATVYRGHDAALNRPVAIKVLDPATTADPGAVERFRREAILAANLEHPHIVPVYDVQEADGLWYIAMRYVPGESLREIVNREGALPLDRSGHILRPVADALDYAHSHGVVHRDIKPGNILVEPSGNVVLTDFGIARSGADAHLTRAGQVMGTADYLAPEQIRGEEATGASDLYSLGVVLYEMLTGTLPFAGDHPAETLYKQVNEPPPPLRSRNPALPAALQPVMDRALHKTPALRYPSGADLVRAFTAAVGAAPAARVQLTPVRAADLSPQPPPLKGEGEMRPGSPLRAGAGVGVRSAAVGRTRALLVGGAVLALLVLGGALFALRGRGQVSGGLGTAPAFAAPAPVAWTGPLRQDNGSDVHANRATHAPTVDGKLADWTGANTWFAANALADAKVSRPSDPSDLSAGFVFGYDAANFYLGATITDNIHVQNSLTRGLALWQGDDIELWFDTDLAGDFTLDPGNGDDVQLGLSPGDFAKLDPEAVQFRPQPLPGTPPGVRVAALPRLGNGGYTLEAAIPWAALHLSHAPTPGSAMGFCAGAGDNDAVGTAQQQHMVSTCRRLQWNVPTTFGNLFW
ncbi:MAG: protein kinase [Chloroflexota bacterium]|nr:protein kinase [Chloroflexota bacterium]